MKAYLEDSGLNYVPMVEATLWDPLGDKQTKLVFVVDTGFQGGVLVPLHEYLELDLNLFEEPKVIVRTAVGGEMEMRVSRALTEVDGARVACHAYTTLGVVRPLLGREVLEDLGLLYRPPDELRVGL